MADDLIDLRRRAEERLARRGGAPSASAPAHALALELEVHRIELDLQQQELLQQRADAEAERDRYAALCDHAPMALLVIDRRSRIVDGNVTAWQLLELHHAYERRNDLRAFLEPKHALELDAKLGGAERTVMEVSIRPWRGGAPVRATLALAPHPRVPDRFHVAILDMTQRREDGRNRTAVPERTIATSRILVVEPYVPGRRALRASLEEFGYDVVDVEDGEHALGISSEFSPALVIVDHQSGQIPSVTLVAELRSRWPEVPAVLLCGRYDAEVRDLPDNAVLLAKPITLGDLERAIESLLGSLPRA